MTRIAMLAGLLTFFLTPVGQCEPRILIVGDSWAGLMWDYNAVQIALAETGLSEFEVKGELTGIGATTAEEWATQQQKKNLITSELEKYPTIDTVILFMGGNDVLFGLLENLSLSYVRSILPDIAQNNRTVAEFILSQKPNIRVLLVEYDYLQLLGFGLVNVSEINDILIEAARLRLDVANEVDRMFYLTNLGLMQHTFGIVGRAAPGELPAPGNPPDHEPLAGGDPSRSSPNGTFDDPIHLTSQGYVVLARRMVEVYLQDWMLNPLQATDVSDWQLY